MGEARAAEIKREHSCALRTKLMVSCRAVTSLLGQLCVGHREFHRWSRAEWLQYVADRGVHMSVGRDLSEVGKSLVCILLLLALLRGFIMI